MKATDVTGIVNPSDLLQYTMQAITSHAVENILAKLPIVPESDYTYSPRNTASLAGKRASSTGIRSAAMAATQAASSWPARPRTRSARGSSTLLRRSLTSSGKRNCC